jgi:hypothetical protein
VEDTDTAIFLLSLQRGVLLVFSEPKSIVINLMKDEVQNLRE